MSSRIDDEDADTVVGGPVKHRGLKKSDRIDESFHSSNSTHPRKGVSLHDFSKTADYALEERPFFVPVGKDGIIVALEKIDRQLRNVSIVIGTSFCYSPRQPTVRADRPLVKQGELEFLNLTSASKAGLHHKKTTTRSLSRGLAGKLLQVSLV
jgi:hypothetical protein